MNYICDVVRVHAGTGAALTAAITRDQQWGFEETYNRIGVRDSGSTMRWFWPRINDNIALRNNWISNSGGDAGIRITDAGFIGINLVPTAPLDILADTDDVNIRMENNTGGYDWYGGVVLVGAEPDTEGHLDFRYRTAADTRVLRLIHTGIEVLSSCGVGTAYIKAFTIEGNTFPQLIFESSETNTVDSYVTTSADKVLARIVACGVDGGNASSEVAAIVFYQSGNAGGAEVPADIIFQTATAAAARTERLRITSAGNTSIGQAVFGANAVSVLGIKTGVAPAAAVANAIQIYSADTSDGTATLSVFTEQVVEVIGTFTASHKWKIKVNGDDYWIQLDKVT